MFIGRDEKHLLQTTETYHLPAVVLPALVNFLQEQHTVKSVRMNNIKEKLGSNHTKRPPEPSERQ